MATPPARTPTGLSERGSSDGRGQLDTSAGDMGVGTSVRAMLRLALLLWGLAGIGCASARPPTLTPSTGQTCPPALVKYEFEEARFDLLGGARGQAETRLAVLVGRFPEYSWIAGLYTLSGELLDDEEFAARVRAVLEVETFPGCSSRLHKSGSPIHP